MNIPPELSTYVMTCREAHMTDTEIEQTLIAKGWPAELVSASLQNHLLRQTPVATEPAATTTSVKKSYGPIKMYGAIALVAIIVIAGLAFLLLNRNEQPVTSAATVTEVSDANYALKLPDGWVSETSNVAGSGITAFYQKGHPDNRMTVFVLPSEKGETYRTRTDTKIGGLKQNGIKADIVGAHEASFAGNKGQVTTVRVASADNLEDVSYHIFAATSLGSTIYTIETVVDQKTWESSEKAINDSLASLTPKTRDLIYQNKN